MKFANTHGSSYRTFPGALDNPNVPANQVKLSHTQSGNKVLFFEGAIPSDEDCRAMTIAGLNAYKKLLETPEFDVTYTYEVTRKRRIIKKAVVDAFDLAYLDTGTIGWAAIILADASGGAQEYIIATDTIGTWGDKTSPILIDNLNGTTGSKNIFKNLSLMLSDKSPLNL